MRRRTVVRMAAFCVEDACVAICWPGCIDLNASSANRLAQLPHVGPARAVDIIAGRPWRVSELRQINGIGDGRLADIRGSGLLCGG